jgi:hypothetical protein
VDTFPHHYSYIFILIAQSAVRHRMLHSGASKFCQEAEFSFGTFLKCSAIDRCEQYRSHSKKRRYMLEYPSIPYAVRYGVRTISRKSLYRELLRDYTRRVLTELKIDN